MTGQDLELSTHTHTRARTGAHNWLTWGQCSLWMLMSFNFFPPMSSMETDRKRSKCWPSAKCVSLTLQRQCVNLKTWKINSLKHPLTKPISGNIFGHERIMQHRCDRSGTNASQRMLQSLRIVMAFFKFRGQSTGTNDNGKSCTRRQFHNRWIS